ncbi:hypothetical protein ACHWQZ_G012791 [Mnemiopsis leidyi]
MKKKEKFEKVLYRPQPYPDNHTEEELFLKSLKRNKNLKTYSFLECVNQGQLPLQQLSCTVSFFLLHFLDIKVTDSMIYVMAVVTMLSYLTMTGFSVHEIRTVILFGGFLFGLSPIIQTLTRSISDDTIYAMVSICLFTNFFLHDYSISNGDYMSKCVSLNAAIFAAVCLASRLDDLNNVLGTIIIAILTYGIIPPARKKMAGSKFMPLVTIFFFTMSLWISYISVPIVIIPLCISAVACLVVVPAFFVHLQKQKDNIYGPWDEAVLTDLVCKGGRNIYAE